MKIALIGATGFVGKEILKELVRRDHEVTVLARSPEKLQDIEGVNPQQLNLVKGSAYNEASVVEAVVDNEVVISSFNPGWDDANLYDNFISGSETILKAVEVAGLKRLIVIGGAGSLYVAPGVQLIDTPEFSQHVPPNVVPGAQAARDFLATIQQNKTLDWTFVSPPAMLAPGERTGTYRIGANDLLMDGEAPAGISVADLAVAIVDEAEQARHIQQRFTVATA